MLYACSKKMSWILEYENPKTESRRSFFFAQLCCGRMVVTLAHRMKNWFPTPRDLEIDFRV
jgi:hypothetical protein